MGVDTLGVSPPAAPASPVLELSGISKSFGETRALCGVSLAIWPGEVHALVGGNGAGKSTLIQVATGAISPDTGRVLMDGDDITRLSRRAFQARGVRAIFQERQIAGDLSVAENVLLDRLPTNRLGMVSWDATRRTAAERLRRVGLDVDPAMPVAALSVAQLQLVEIARAVSYDARLIVMDEPTASLHRDEVRGLFAVIRSLRAAGVAVLYISHHLDEVFEISDRVTVLRDGERVGEAATADATMADIVTMIFGRRIETERTLTDRRADTDPIIVADDLHAPGLRGVSLAVHPGEVVAVTGGIGAGTSALAEALSGATALRRGAVTVAGQVISSRYQAARLVGFLPSDRKRRGLLLDKSVADNVGLARLATKGPWLVHPRGVRRHAESVRAVTNLKTGSVDASVRTLSGGNQQKVLLGRWLAIGSAVLVVDEPTAGVDMASKFEIYRLFRRLAGEGVAVVVCTTDFQEVPHVADRVLVMRDGRIVGECSAVEATEHQLMDMETAR